MPASASQAASVSYTTYSLPSALTSSPFNCTLSSGTYVCGSVNLDKDSILSLTSNVSLWVKNGSFTSQKNLTTANHGYTFNLAVDNAVSMQKDTDIDMNITASGAVSFAKNAVIDGNITSSSNVSFSKDSTVNGNLVVSGNLTGAKNVVINGTCQVAGTKSNIICTGGSVSLHHVRVTFSTPTSTCGTTPVTITACASADSNGSCTAYTGGISGTLVADGEDDVTEVARLSFNIPSGSSSVSGSLPAITTAQTASLSFENVSKTTTTSGTCWNGTDSSCDLVVASCGAHHVRLDHSGSGVTCIPATVTINACSGADSSGTCTASTTGMTGTLVTTLANGTQQTDSFTIPSGASSVTKSVSVTSSQTVTFSTTGLSPGTSSSTTCWNGSSASCSYFYDTAALELAAPDHVAAIQQTATIKAVKQVGSTTTCTSALANGSYTIEFGCTYSNPTTGTQSPVISNGSSNVTMACNGSTSSSNSLSLAFSSGQASFSLTYPDAGKVTLLAKYSGGGLTLTGSDAFVAAPAKFTISTSTSPLKADAAFDATVKAVNALGATMPNFGKESFGTGATGHRASLAFSKCGGATTGVFGGNLSAGVVSMPQFSSGASTVTGLQYSEVGTLDATATLTSNTYTTPSYYLDLGSSFAVTGTTNTASGGNCSGSFGTFIPSRLVTTLEPTSTKFAYSGIPFKVRVTAKNANGVTTVNYTKDYAKDITLSAVTDQGTAVASTVGTLSNTTLLASAFGSAAGGYADATPTFTFPAVTGGVNGAKLAPQTIYIRAAESGSGATSASTGTPPPYETSVPVRYGRLRLFNAYGSSLSTVKMPVQAEYWNGTVWVINGDDSTTKIPASAIGFPSGGTATLSGPGADLTLTAGKGTLTLSNSGNAKGWGYVTAKLGASVSGNSGDSCPGTATGVTAASLGGLRSYHGCGDGGYTYDPAARANFGIQSQETKGVVHVREVFN
ncbi:hypothetical protein GCM10027277_02150 [Pseudoduganella ginsengisoli]